MRPSLSTEVWASRIPRALLPPLYSLSSLELHYCAWLREAHLQDIIDGCPNLATFKFTSEASPTTGRPLPSSSGFDFLGPALVLKALRPRSETLTAISIRYMPLLDLLFRTRGSMDTDKNLIQTLGDFPNLRVLQISHGALGWKDIDGPKNNSWDGLGAYAREFFEKDHLDLYQERGIQLLVDYEDAYEDQGDTFPAAIHEGLRLRHAVTFHPDIVKVTGLNFERDYERRRCCDHHELPEGHWPEDATLRKFHWQRGTRVLYGVLVDGTSTEHYINERRKTVVMHRDYGP
ncbi:hypothetical protein SMACR_09514 [Sordaria macrospora]|uniref:WGS project CABT00000000 data, contig 2.96 n=2 Tax=Sordaria macrospora TaxID=5147 RepID=F7WC56_SORMK|nr:uncharacterized protein SMAC_09514 [Sordaria macrospora k-hell]KAA8636600.1 hypothetical protein SMACR_09514 [Sordaria macrospora]WPJ63279.1 hypothetical protein SMAC4_09514 [Sordaria macrospora]CCC05550.1 unnamed protein product [Sordaria macrospora k-hell]